jgi:hypothetical protein
MHRLSRLLLAVSFLLNGFLVFKFINHHYINIDNVEYVGTRLNVYVQTKNCGRNFNHVQKFFPSAVAMADEPCTRNENIFKSYIEPIDMNSKALRYSYKYLETLKICQNGDKMLCMIVEDDILFLHQNETTWNNIVLNTMSLVSDDEVFWDCSKRGIWFPTTSNGIKTLCRIYNTDLLPAFTDCIAAYLQSTTDTEEKGIDVLIDKCQIELGITQKRFLLVNRSGQKSPLGY